MASRKGVSRRVAAITLWYCSGGARPLELGDARAGAILVLLRRAAADAARAVDEPTAHDRHRALVRDHVPALGRGDALDDRRTRALLQLAARSREGGRGDRLALRAVDAAPDSAVHAVEGHEPAAGVTHD